MQSSLGPQAGSLRTRRLTCCAVGNGVAQGVGGCDAVKQTTEEREHLTSGLSFSTHVKPQPQQAVQHIASTSPKHLIVNGAGLSQLCFKHTRNAVQPAGHGVSTLFHVDSWHSDADGLMGTAQEANKGAAGAAAAAASQRGTLGQPFRPACVRAGTLSEPGRHAPALVSLGT